MIKGLIDAFIKRLRKTTATPSNPILKKTQCDTTSTCVLSKADHLSSLCAPWTSKNMFISMTLISLCIKDKCLSLSIPELYLSMSPNKGKGQLIHAKHASSLNFWFPLWALFFLIKRGLLSSSLAEECFWYLPSRSVSEHSANSREESGMITYLSITVLMWLPFFFHSVPSPLSRANLQTVEWHMGLHRKGFNYTSHALLVSRNSHCVISKLL